MPRYVLTTAQSLAWHLPVTVSMLVPQLDYRTCKESIILCPVQCYAMLSDSFVSNLWPHGLQPTRLLCPWGSSSKNTEVGCHALLQGIFPTQRSNPGLPHCRQILYHVSHQGSPRILEWVTYPFSRGSSQPRNLTGVSYIAGRFFTSWATKEAQEYWSG